MIDDFKMRELRDQLFDDGFDKHVCTECKKPCGTEIEWVGDDGKGNGTFVCEACVAKDEEGEAK